MKYITQIMNGLVVLFLSNSLLATYNKCCPDQSMIPLTLNNLLVKFQKNNGNAGLKDILKFVKNERKIVCGLLNDVSSNYMRTLTKKRKELLKNTTASTHCIYGKVFEQVLPQEFELRLHKKHIECHKSLHASLTRSQKRTFLKHMDSLLSNYYSVIKHMTMKDLALYE